MLDGLWSVEQAAVAGDERKRSFVSEPDAVMARGRRVEKTQPCALSGDGQVRAEAAVDENLVAEPADRADRRLAEVEAAPIVEPLVLEQHGNVVDAVASGQSALRAPGLVDDPHAGQSAVNLVVGALVRMRVVPQCRGRLVDAPSRPPGVASFDGLVRASVCDGGHVHAMPVHRGRLGKMVGDAHLDAVASGRTERRAEEDSVDAPGLARFRVGTQSGATGLQAQVEHANTVGAARRLEERRHVQRPLETQSVGRARALVQYREHYDGAGGGHQHQDARERDACPEQAATPHAVPHLPLIASGPGDPAAAESVRA